MRVGVLPQGAGPFFVGGRASAILSAHRGTRDPVTPAR